MKMNKWNNNLLPIKIFDNFLKNVQKRENKGQSLPGDLVIYLFFACFVHHIIDLIKTLFLVFP